MHLEVGRHVTLAGVVSRRVARTKRDGSGYVTAELRLTDTGTAVTCVWWDAERAPGNGAEVQVRGRVREYQGKPQLTVDGTVLRTPPEGPARLIRFFRDCLDTESLLELVLPANGGSHLAFHSGAAPGHEDVTRLPAQPGVARWCDRRLLAGQADDVLAGFPLIHGTGDVAGERRPCLAPLFTMPLRLSADTDRTYVLRHHHTRTAEPNPYALTLLGVPPEERPLWSERLTPSSPSTGWSAVPSALEAMVDAGLLHATPLTDPAALSQAAADTPVVNGAVLMVAEGARATAQVLQELDDLQLRDAEDLRSGPLGAVLGVDTPPVDTGIEVAAHPWILPGSIAHDEAITSAVSHPITVVTGPPGTGKSQLVVNAVAEAVTAGRSVLFASKNNKAVDVVFERLAAVSAHAVPLRAGNRDYRPTLAATIHRALDRDPPPTSDVQAWPLLRDELEQVYADVRHRGRLEAELASATQAAAEAEHSVPPVLHRLDDDPAVPVVPGRVAALQQAITESVQPLPRWVGRRREERRRRLALTAAADDLVSVLPLAAQTHLQPLRDSGDHGAILTQVRSALALQAQGARIRALRGDLDLLPSRTALEQRLDALTDGRVDAGRGLFEARWSALVDHAAPSARASARRLAGALDGDAPVGGIPSLAREALRMFPVWGVTNLAARSNLPLVAGLFDVVIIDEASQCDIASALPLLYRAKHAVVIGDPNQLRHITQLTEAAEHRLAARSHIADRTAAALSYRTFSLFDRSAVVAGVRTLLDQHYRSHEHIIGFSNAHIYGQRLTIRTPARAAAPGPLVWQEVGGAWRRGPSGSAQNPAEAQAVVDLLADRWDELDRDGLSIGVIAPFRAQATLVSDLLARRLPEARGRVTVATAHRFQGDERDVILLSPTVAPGMPDYLTRFAGDRNLLNVAVTRARRQLVVVADAEACLAAGGLLAALVDHVAAHGVGVPAG
jgi:RecA/RadA recombinase